MNEERTMLSDFEQTDVYYAAQVVEDLKAYKNALETVRASSTTWSSGEFKWDEVSIIVPEGGTGRKSVFSIQGPGEDAAAHEAYAKLVYRLLDALDDYLNAAILDKEKELLRDFNIDPQR